MCLSDGQQKSNKQKSVKFKDNDNVEQITERRDLSKEQLLEQFNKLLGRDYCFGMNENSNNQMHPEVSLLISDNSIKIDSMSSST